MSYLPLVLLLAVSSCSAPSITNQPLPKEKSPFARTYWPLDHASQQSQTVLHGIPTYRITVVTACLNDSAVVNPITTDSGPALDISHNYESVLTITKGTRLLTQARLTKELFRHDQVAHTLGPLTALVLSRTAFVKYRASEFHFTTRLGVPDSDIFAEAEIALAPGQKLRLVSTKVPEEVE
jgi:hypothetical protein